MTRRVPEMQRIVQAFVAGDTEGEAEVTLLLGDLNSPSHHDWTTATQSRHLGHAFQWPVSVLLSSLGFTDSFRHVRGEAVLAFQVVFTWLCLVFRSCILTR